jgi:hypothetical protein
VISLTRQIFAARYDFPFAPFLLFLCCWCTKAEFGSFGGHTDLVDQILSSGHNYGIIQNLDVFIKFAVNKQHWDILERIVRYKKLQKSLVDACESGDLDKLNDLLLNSSVSPGDGGNMCLIASIKNGHIKLVRRLLNDERISLTRTNLKILDALIMNNQIEIMKLLLPRLEPDLASNFALNLACELGRIEIVDILLQDRRVDPTAFSNRALKIAASRGYYHIIGRLLTDRRVRDYYD